MGTSVDFEDSGGYTGNAYEEAEGGQAGFSQGGQYEGDEYQAVDEGLEYTGEQNFAEYQDEVLDLQIDEPLDDDFQVSNAFSCFSLLLTHTLHNPLAHFLHVYSLTTPAL